MQGIPLTFTNSHQIPFRIFL